MNLKDIKIGLRLGLGFGSILILTVVLVALGLFNIQKVHGLLFKVVNGDVKKIGTGRGYEGDGSGRGG